MEQKKPNLNSLAIMIQTIMSTMLKERIHNVNKEGNNEAWRNLTSKEILFDLYYHIGKLQQGILNKNKEKMLEHIGDIGNYLGFLIIHENLNELINAEIS